VPSIYRTAKGRAEILTAYEKRLAALALPVESRFVDTRVGRTHVLLAGPCAARPLFARADLEGWKAPVLDRIRAFLAEPDGGDPR
jgi:hypothetical protein